ncbi:MAG TPA: hypothetical protein VGM34_00890 [Chlamydiales bacterium]|jgi:hypothetical protein
MMKKVGNEHTTHKSPTQEKKSVNPSRELIETLDTVKGTNLQFPTTLTNEKKIKVTQYPKGAAAKATQAFHSTKKN